MQSANLFRKILALLLILLGLYCMVSPRIHQPSLVYMLGVAILLDAGRKLRIVSNRRKAGRKDYFSLLSAVLSLVVGVLLLLLRSLGWEMPAALVALIAFWMLSKGLIIFANAIHEHLSWKKNTQNPREGIAMLAIVTGTLLCVLGLLCYFNPAFIGRYLPFFVGYCLLTAGVPMWYYGTK